MTMTLRSQPSHRQGQTRACFAEAYPFPVGAVVVMLLTGELALVIGMLALAI
jgi:uncharacterized MAPEG superfamily protein